RRLSLQPQRRRAVSITRPPGRLDRIDRCGAEWGGWRRGPQVSRLYLRPKSHHLMYAHDGFRAMLMVRRLSIMGPHILLSRITFGYHRSLFRLSACFPGRSARGQSPKLTADAEIAETPRRILATSVLLIRYSASCGEPVGRKSHITTFCYLSCVLKGAV